MFLLCYAALCKTYLSSILMSGLMPGDGSEGELSLSQRLNMKLLCDVRSDMSGGRSAVTLTPGARD